MAQLTISASVNGGLLIRGIAPDDTPLERFESNVPIVVNVKDISDVRYYFKAPGYNLVKGTLSITEDTVFEIANATVNPSIPNAENMSRSLSLEYDGQFGFLEYGYGLETPEQAGVELDAILSTEPSLKLIADYSEFGSKFTPDMEHTASDITVPNEVGRIYSVSYHDGRFYLVGDGGTPATNAQSVHKLFRYKIVDGDLVKDTAWATNPQNVQTTVNGKTIRSGGMDIWNGHIYIADGDSNNNNNRDDNRAMSVHNMLTGAKEGIYTPAIPAGFPEGNRNARYFMSGVIIDEPRNRMLILYKTHRGDISILETELLDRFMDNPAVKPVTNIVHDIPATTLTTPITGAVDDTGVLYISRSNGNTEAFDLNDGIALPLATFTPTTAGVVVSDVTIYRGVVLLASATGATRGLRAYALRNRKYTKSGDESPENTPRMIRRPIEGENPIDTPIMITQNGIIIDYDFIRVVPDDTPQWRRRSLDANLVSRYGGKHVPHWTERGRVYLCSLERSETPLEPAEVVPQPAIDLDAFIARLKVEMPNAVWDFEMDPTDGVAGAIDNKPQAIAHYVKQINNKATDTITNTNTIKTDVENLEPKVSQIKTQTDKMIFNADNHLRINESVISAEITTLSESLSQARIAIEGDLTNVENYLRPMQQTLNALTQASIANAVWSEATDAGFGAGKTLKDIINFLGIVGIGTEELIDIDGDTPLVKANAVGYAIRDKQDNIRLKQLAKTSVNTDTKPLEANAVKFVKESS
ncbi:MAG: hypothetical protein OXC46_03130 [Thaumarchaeota archaeon]|nr:hypothetical protein [Nitrososphaerota archaeon]